MACNIPIAELLMFLWNVTKTPAGFICYEEALGDLETKMNRLVHLKNDVKEKVKMAGTQSVPSRVSGWISLVEGMKDEMDELMARGTREMQNNCCGSCCPKNSWARYKIGKKIVWKLRVVAEQYSEGEKHLDSVPLPLEPYDKVLKCLTEVGKGVIGLHGPGGVGKTAILTQISTDFLDSPGGFDFKIWVEGSQDPNPERIQAEIGKEIGFLEHRWKNKSFADRAKDISDVLEHKRFLILLDDIWTPVNLAEMGIPPTIENDSKLVLTTRSEEVCDKMEVEEKIKVGSLTWEKAWALFRKNVGENILNIHPEIPTLAEKIARMCNGLPLSLIVIGRAMARKRTLHEWYLSTKVLTDTTSASSGTSNQDLALLKFGYDSLDNDTARSCFLYCALFPEDFSINKSRLIDYWIGEGFLRDYSTVQRARNEGYSTIDALIHACLLKDEGRAVKMHDLIREMALWVALQSRKEKDKYSVQAGIQLKEAPEVGQWEGVRRMSLMSNHIEKLTRAPRCYELLSLLLGRNHLKMVQSDFFQHMMSLKVLDLSENRELTDFPSGILNISSLQYLNLSRTGIRQLPTELKKLVNLKCLNLEHTYQLQTIPVKVISSFLDLKVLRMFHCASSDLVVGDGIRIGRHESFASELKCLKNLNMLTITLRNDHSLQIFVTLDVFRLCTQSLSLQQFRHYTLLDISFLESMTCLDELEFIDCSSLKELKVDASLTTSFKSLRRISIVNCPKLEDLTWLSLAPKLEFLQVSRCSNMSEIISIRKLNERNLKLFENLKVLQLISLPQLKSIYSDALPFSYMKEMTIDDCPHLKKLPLNSNSAKEHRIIIQGWEDWWRRPEWEDEDTRRIFLSSFKACMY